MHQFESLKDGFVIEKPCVLIGLTTLILNHFGILSKHSLNRDERKEQWLCVGVFKEASMIMAVPILFLTNLVPKNTKCVQNC